MGRSVARRLSFLLLASSAGCGLFGEDGPSISLVASATSAVLQQAGSQTITLQIGRTNFEKPVTLSAEGPLPTGVTFAFAPNPVAPELPSSTLTITATGAAIPGTAALTVKATGEGVTETAVLIDVTVNIRGSHSVTLSNSAINVAQGGGGQSTVVLARQNSNAGNVTLSASGAPSGMTVSFGESPTAAGATSVTVAAGGSVAAGTYDISISGTQPGLTPTPAPATLAVTVIAPPSTSNISIPFCADEVPAWFAYRNEGFLWQPVTTSGSAFTFAATEKVSIAFAYAFGNASDVRFYNATRAELAGITDRDCAGPKSHAGTTANIAAGQTGLVTLGGAFDIVTSNAFLLEGVADRPLDLVATRGILASGQFTPDRMVIRRGINLANNASIPVVDFAAAESVVPASNALSVSGVESNETVYVENVFHGTTVTTGLLFTSENTSSTHTMYSAPAASLTAGDVHALYIDAFNGSGTAAHTLVTHFASTGDRVETLGPLLTSPTVTAALIAPYLRERGQLQSQSDYPTAARFVYLQGTSGAPKFVVVVTTAAHLGALPSTWDITVPDVSGVAGFNTGWMHTSGPGITFSAEAFSASGSLLFGAAPSVGDVVRLAYRESTASSAISPALRAAGSRMRSISDAKRGVLDPPPQYLRR